MAGRIVEQDGEFKWIPPAPDGTASLAQWNVFKDQRRHQSIKLRCGSCLRSISFFESDSVIIGASVRMLREVRVSEHQGKPLKICSWMTVPATALVQGCKYCQHRMMYEDAATPAEVYNERRGTHSRPKAFIDLTPQVAKIELKRRSDD